MQAIRRQAVVPLIDQFPQQVAWAKQYRVDATPILAQRAEQTLGFRRHDAACLNQAH